MKSCVLKITSSEWTCERNNACCIFADPTVFLLGRCCRLGYGLRGFGLLRRLLGRALLRLGPRPRAGLDLLRLARPGLGPRHGALRGLGLGRLARRAFFGLRPRHGALRSLGLRRLRPRPRLLEPFERQLLVVVELVLLLLVLLELRGLLVLLEHFGVLRLGGSSLVLAGLLLRVGQRSPHVPELGHSLRVGHATGHEFITL